MIQINETLTMNKSYFSLDVFLLYKKTNIDEASKLNRMLFRDFTKNEILYDYDYLLRHLVKNNLTIEQLEFINIMLTDHLLGLNNLGYLSKYLVELCEKDNSDCVNYIVDNFLYCFYIPEIDDLLCSQSSKAYFKLVLDKLRELFPNRIDSYIIYESDGTSNYVYYKILNNIEFFVKANKILNHEINYLDLEKVDYLIELYGTKEYSKSHKYLVEYYYREIDNDTDISYLHDDHKLQLFIIKCFNDDINSANILYDNFKEAIDKHGISLLKYIFTIFVINEKFGNAEWLIAKFGNDVINFSMSHLPSIESCEFLLSLSNGNRQELIDNFINNSFMFYAKDKEYSEWLWNNDVNNILKNSETYKFKFTHIKDYETMVWFLNNVEDKSILFNCTSLYKKDKDTLEYLLLLDNYFSNKSIALMFSYYIKILDNTDDILDRIYDNNKNALHYYFNNKGTNIFMFKTLMLDEKYELAGWFLDKIVINDGIDNSHMLFLRTIDYDLKYEYYSLIKDEYLNDEEKELKNNIINSTENNEIFLVS